MVENGKAKEEFQRIGLWGTLNALRQHGGVTELWARKLAGIKTSPEEATEMLKQVPFGSSISSKTYVNQSSSWGRAACAGLIAAAGGLGWLLAERNMPSPPQLNPIDAVIEWEVPLDE